MPGCCRKTVSPHDMETDMVFFWYGRLKSMPRQRLSRTVALTNTKRTLWKAPCGTLHLVAPCGCQLDEPYGFPCDLDATMRYCTYWYLPFLLSFLLLCSVGNKKTYYYYYYPVMFHIFLSERPWLNNWTLTSRTTSRILVGMIVTLVWDDNFHTATVHSWMWSVQIWQTAFGPSG